MAYQRKTKDVFVIQGRYPSSPYGWEDECEEETRAEGRAQLKCYRENGGGEYRLVKRRLPLTAIVTPITYLEGKDGPVVIDRKKEAKA
jgi:hypothetical protein